MKINFFFILHILICNNLQGQSNFEFKPISSKYKLVEIKYNGKFTAVADSEETRLDPFTFMLLGNLKKASVTANGTVYTKFLFSNNQKIIIESSENHNQDINKWKSIEKNNLPSLFIKIKQRTKFKNRESYYLQFENCNIYLIDIKRENIKLFKWMIGTLEFS